MTKKAFLGTDVSKSTLDFALCFLSNPGNYSFLRVTNDQKGFKELFRWLKKMEVDLHELVILMEHTGNYMLEFLMFLESKKVKPYVVSGLQIKKSLGIQRGKNDKVDAQRIAEFAMEKHYKLQPSKLPSKELAALKQLFTLRIQLVKQQTAFKNSIQSQRLVNKYTGCKVSEEVIVKQIETLSESIKQVESEMEKIIASSTELKKNYQLLLTIAGIGPIIALVLIIYTNNFHSFDNARQFQTYVGAAPFKNESGTYKGKTKISHLGYKKIKTLLHSGARSAITHDAETRNYYNRKLRQGKLDNQVVNAVVAKLILRAFSVVKRGTPFVKLYANNINQKMIA